MRSYTPSSESTPRLRSCGSEMTVNSIKKVSERNGCYNHCSVDWWINYIKSAPLRELASFIIVILPFSRVHFVCITPVFCAHGASKLRFKLLRIGKRKACISTFSSKYRLYHSGRGRRTWTLSTRFWRPLLYQLSYTPKCITTINIISAIQRIVNTQNIFLYFNNATILNFEKIFLKMNASYWHCL